MSSGTDVAIGRNLRDLIDIVTGLDVRGVAVKLLTNGAPVTGPSGSGRYRVALAYPPCRD
jgi:hypothetical protein